MAISVEAILADAHKLVLRLKEHDNLADCLITRTQSLQKQQEAMKQFQDCLNELNEVARHRPRLGLIITLAQENSKIRELQSENIELRQSLSDHQSALEVIMTKYREQMANLARANQVEHSLLQRSAGRQEDIQQKSEKISEMTAIMYQAVNTEECVDTAGDVIARLERENLAMRKLLQLELLHFDQTAPPENQKIQSADVAIQTSRSSPDENPFCTGDFATIKPRLSSTSSARTPAEKCATDNDVPNSLTQQNTDVEEPLTEFLTSSTLGVNSEQTISAGLETEDNICSSSTVSVVDSASTDDLETGSVNSSESLETLVDANDLATNEECI